MHAWSMFLYFCMHIFAVLLCLYFLGKVIVKVSFNICHLSEWKGDESAKNKSYMRWFHPRFNCVWVKTGFVNGS